MHSGGGSHLLKHGVRLKESLRESDRQTDLSYVYIYIHVQVCRSKCSMWWNHCLISFWSKGPAQGRCPLHEGPRCMDITCISLNTKHILYIQAHDHVRQHLGFWRLQSSRSAEPYAQGAGERDILYYIYKHFAISISRYIWCILILKLV